MGFNYLFRIVIVAIAILGIFTPFKAAHAGTTAYDAVNTSSEGYRIEFLHGQKPQLPGFKGTWYERGNERNYQVLSGGLSVPANGTVGAVGNYAGNDARIAGVGGNSIISLHYETDRQSNTRTNYWMRLIIKPTTKKESYFTILTSSASFSLGGKTDAYGIYSPDLETISGSPSPLKLNENNLIVLHFFADRSPNKPDTFKLWLNPSSYSDIEAGINANQVAIGNVLDGNDKLITGILDWANARIEGDEFLIGTSLKDVLFPAT